MHDVLDVAAITVLIGLLLGQGAGLMSKRATSLGAGLMMAALVAGDLVWGWSSVWMPVLAAALAAWNFHEAVTAEGPWRMGRDRAKGR